MRRVLQRLGLVCLPVVFAFSVFATNAPAPAKLADTNFIDPEIVGDNPAVQKFKDAMKKEGVKPESLLNESFLFASLFWGTIGSGYLLYARKQREIPPFIGGVAMIAVSFMSSWFWMSVISIAIMVGVWQIMKQGD